MIIIRTIGEIGIKSLRFVGLVGFPLFHSLVQVPNNQL